MTRLLLTALSLSLAVACTYSEDKYEEDFEANYCDQLTSCEADIVAGYMNLGMDETLAQGTYDQIYSGSCEGGTTDTGAAGTECTYNPDAAEECADAVGDLACGFWVDGSGYPAICSDVYEC